MCGIIGGNAFKSKDNVIDGIKAISHRGTDSNRLFSFSNGMYLAHNRLSIQDLSQNADQPMVSSCGRYYLIFNGELWKTTFDKYNTILRERYDFKTEKSDTELLLYFLIEYKEKLLSELRNIEGMFAFAFYDKQEDVLRIARDFIGRIPLYYYFEDGKIAFSSEAKGITQSLDQIKFFRAKRNFPKEIKAQEKIKLVDPGSLITYQSNGDLLFEEYELKKDIWLSFKAKDNPDFIYIKTEEELDTLTNEKDDLGLEHYAKGFRERLKKAVENELIADVPICTILSGGVDSTIITHILAEINPNIEAFVVHIGDESDGKDDLFFARKAAEHIGVKLNEVIITREMMEQSLEETIWACEHWDWRQVSCSVAQLHLAKAIREKGFKVVFGGEGSDEIFASYNDVKRWSWRPLDYHRKRVNLVSNLQKGNCPRVNTAMMYGGEVELRCPFMSKEVVRYGLTLPVKYRSNKEGKGNKMKYLLRKAYEKEISNDDLVWRPKITMQIGCHTDYLKEDQWQKQLKQTFSKLFQDKNVPTDFTEKQFRDPKLSVKIEEIEIT